MRSKIQDIITAFQDSGKEAYGPAGYAWSSGYLGSVLTELLYNHVPANHRDSILQDMIRYTERNRQQDTEEKKEI